MKLKKANINIKTINVNQSVLHLAYHLCLLNRIEPLEEEEEKIMNKKCFLLQKIKVIFPNLIKI